MFKKITTVLALITSTSLFATDLDNVKIEKIMLDTAGHTGKVFIKLDRRQATPISCHTNAGWEYVLKVENDYDNLMFTSLLTAYASGKAIYLRGTNSCTIHSTVETLNRIELK